MFSADTEKIKKETQILEQEYLTVANMLSKKKKEIDGLVLGLKKHDGNISVSNQIKDLIKQRIEELKGLNIRIESLKIKFKKAKQNLDRLFSDINAFEKHNLKKETMIKEAIMEQSAEDEQLVEQIKSATYKAFNASAKSNAQPEKVKTLDISQQPHANKKNEGNEDMIKIKKEQEEPKTKIIAPLKMVKNSNNLYKKAADESSAQEKFLRSQASKISGSA